MSWGERWFLLIGVELLTIAQWVKVRCEHQLIEWCQQFHQYQQKSPLTSTHWVMVNNSTKINQNHVSPKLIEWWLLTIAQWVKVRCDFYWYWWNCWPSLNELRWEVVLADIGVEWCQQFHQYQQKSPLTSTHWVIVNNSTKINQNHLSPQLIEWCQQFHQWVKMRGDFYWYWWNCWPSLNELRWEVIFIDIGGIVDHHSMRKIYSHINSLSDVNNSTHIKKITSHFNSLSDSQQFHQNQPESPLT
jgi:hypothetical protein